MKLKVRCKDKSKVWHCVVWRGQMKHTEESFNTMLDLNTWMLKHGVTLDQVMLSVETRQRLEFF